MGRWTGIIGALSAITTMAQDGPRLGVGASGNRLELTWPVELRLRSGITVAPVYELQWSADLRHWSAVPAPPITPAGDWMTLAVEKPGDLGFYRIAADLAKALDDIGPSTGEEVYGYTAQLKAELKRLGQISVPEFAALYPNPAPPYLASVDFDITRSQFWTEFNTDPQVYNQSLPPGSLEYRACDFRPDSRELALLRTNGFVVSERMSSHSFADQFYRIYADDLPVFIGADAVLHAWHKSYAQILQDLEETYLIETLQKILNGMTGQISAVATQVGTGVLGPSVEDADYFLTIARSLLAGTPLPSVLGVQVDGAVTDALWQIEELKLVEDYNLFGGQRTVDFSQFKPRGYYENSERLRRYFRAMMWCGRIDLRLSKGTVLTNTNVLRQLGTALVLHELWLKSGQTAAWRQFDDVIRTFVGQTDSMNFAQLGEFRAQAGLTNLAQVQTLDILKKFQADLLLGNIGFQDIAGDYYEIGDGPTPVVLPRSFTVMGQRFIFDSWAMSQLVYGNILWDDSKVHRRIPSALDIAFSALGNSQIVPELVARMTNPNGLKFRDDYPYQHNLAAVRSVIDAQTPEVWTNNIYNSWLSALRELSPPTTDAKYPQAMRTRAWALKNLNTQLASWTQLRHDTILYAKQSYTGIPICSYPYAYVEPRPEFWLKMEQMAAQAADLINKIPFQGTVTLERNDFGWDRQSVKVDLSAVQANQVNFLRSFAGVMATLREIADAEQAQQSLTQQQTDFLKNLIRRQVDPYTQFRDYSGWYPNLYYRSVKLEPGEVGFNGTHASDEADYIVADVHTDPPSIEDGDPGCVLHEAIGRVNLMLICIDSGPDLMMYAGPVMSYYEFQVGGVKRMSDSEWSGEVKLGTPPFLPAWALGFLVPARP
jgi:hypothetical protein